MGFNIDWMSNNPKRLKSITVMPTYTINDIPKSIHNLLNLNKLKVRINIPGIKDNKKMLKSFLYGNSDFNGTLNAFII